MQRLQKNIGGYRGETIDIARVLREIERAVEGKNWVSDKEGNFLAYRRPNPSARKNVYLSTGIHGDEPAGPLAALKLLTDDLWPADLAIWLCPCLNPTGFALNTRANAQGIDLNRDYRHLVSEEVRIHVAWLQQQPRFDISICLHEDWEAGGFYVYEVNPNHLPSLAEKIIASVATVCPIDQARLIDNWEASQGIIRPPINPAERPQWPEAIYLLANKSQLSYTMEAPSDFPIDVRVAALTEGVRTALDLL